MDAPRCLSFLEFELRSGAVRLGAGETSAVLARPISPPFFRLYCVEPSANEVRVRVRLGKATIGPEGLRHVAQRDPMLQLGAWARCLRLSGAIARELQAQAWPFSTPLHGGDGYHIWLGCDVDTIMIYGSTRAKAIRSLKFGQRRAGIAALEIAGSSQDVVQMLGIMRLTGIEDQTASFQPR